MGQRRKHVTHAALNQEVTAPSDGQAIVRALGPRGGNIIEARQNTCSYAVLHILPLHLKLTR
jgi:hypothetical protein